MTQVNTTQDLITYTVRLGDDSIIFGHRLSEWVSHGPFLEEDIALGNVALDLLGHARMYYSYAAKLTNNEPGSTLVTTEDDFAFLRDEREFQNHLIHELPRGNFAETVVRQLLVDNYNKYHFAALKASKDETLAAIAAKADKEVAYHCRRSKEWTLRLGDGTQESHEKIQAALDGIWGYTHEIFEQDDVEQRLIAEGIAVDSLEFKDKWFADVKAIIEQATLKMPTSEWAVRGGRKGYHTENLGHLLTEMQFVYRSFPEAKW